MLVSPFKPLKALELGSVRDCSSGDGVALFRDAGRTCMSSKRPIAKEPLDLLLNG